MKKVLLWLGIIPLIISAPGIASASLVNGGFEAGLTGWDANGSASPVNSYTENNTGAITYLPVDGSFFALLESGTGTGIYSTLTQTFSMSSGSLLQGWAAFDTADYMPFNDDAYVKIFDNAGGLLATPWSSNVAAVDDYGYTPWTFWSWTAPANADYKLQFGVANQGDNSGESDALFDANITTDVVPEPASLSLLGLGLLGLIRYRKKK